MADSNSLSTPGVIVENLKRVSGALQDVMDRDAALKKAFTIPPSPGIPPAVFGAGGKM